MNADVDADRPVVGVLGAGTMGSAIAWLFARSGLPVRISDTDAVVAERGIARLRQRLEGASTTDVVEESLAGLGGIQIVPDAQELGRQSTVIIEAVSEELTVKERVLADVSATAAPSAIIASNTSSLLISGLAESVRNPSRFIGIHFFNPADAVPGVEVIPHATTDPAVVADAMGLLRAVGKEPAVAEDSPGFIANRLQFALFHEALRCVDEGLATVEDIDSIVRSTFGFRLAAYGPFRIADMAGLDVYRSILAVLRDGIGAPFTVPERLSRMVEQGDLGVKSGRGFSEYAEGSVPRLLEEREAVYRDILAATGPLRAGRN